MLESDPLKREFSPHELKVLFLPFYEGRPSLRSRTLAGLRQRKQKRGLREALMRHGQVKEIDYRKVFKKSGRDGLVRAVIRTATEFQPNIILSELHSSEMMEASDVIGIRNHFRNINWVNWNGDYRDPNTWSAEDIELMAACDLWLVISWDSVSACKGLGIRADYWQIGWEPDGVGQDPRWLTPSHDVLFMGNCYSNQRIELARVLKRLDLKLGLYGSGWPKGWARGNTLYDFKKGCRLIRASKIVIGDSQWPESGFTGDRIFQSLAAGGALVMHQYFKDYEKLGLIDSKHLLIWRDFDQLSQMIEFWLRPENEDRRQRISSLGQEFCIKHHSFDYRVGELKEKLSLLIDSKKI